MWVRSLGWEDPLEEEMAIHSSILPGKSYGQRSLAGYSPRGHTESDSTERLPPLRLLGGAGSGALLCLPQVPCFESCH